MSRFVDSWGDPIEGSGWVRKGNIVERAKPGVPGTVECVRIRGGGTRSVTTRSAATPSRPKYKPSDIVSWARPEDIELRTSVASPICVSLDETARSRIVDEVLECASHHEGEGRETGGFIYGRRVESRPENWLERSADVLEVTFAAYAGKETARASQSVMLDLEYGLSVERTLKKHARSKRLLGDYHSHPSGDGTPSPADLRSWLRCLQHLGVQNDDRPAWLLGDEVAPDCFLGIIVTRSAGGNWFFPRFHAWITRADGDRVVCEPAAL